MSDASEFDENALDLAVKNLSPEGQAQINKLVILFHAYREEVEKLTELCTLSAKVEKKLLEDIERLDAENVKLKNNQAGRSSVL